MLPYVESNEQLGPPEVLPIGGKDFTSNRRTASWPNSRGKYAPEPFIGLELSLIPQVESVFVELLPGRRMVRVFTIINERSHETRERIYAREQSIIDAFPDLDFNFRVISRAGRSLSDIIEQIGKLVYQR
jgi:hypothetical protein